MKHFRFCWVLLVALVTLINFSSCSISGEIPTGEKVQAEMSVGNTIVECPYEDTEDFNYTHSVNNWVYMSEKGGVAKFFYRPKGYGTDTLANIFKTGKVQFRRVEFSPTLEGDMLYVVYKDETSEVLEAMYVRDSSLYIEYFASKREPLVFTPQGTKEWGGFENEFPAIRKEIGPIFWFPKLDLIDNTGELFHLSYPRYGSVRDTFQIFHGQVGEKMFAACEGCEDSRSWIEEDQKTITYFFTGRDCEIMSIVKNKLNDRYTIVSSNGSKRRVRRFQRTKDNPFVDYRHKFDGCGRHYVEFWDTDDPKE